MQAPPTKRVRVEVCAASPADARAAESAGADRVELNAALELGGLTPSLGTLLQTRQAVAIPIIAMVRPRPGGFCYSPSEFDLMCRDAELMLRHGANGIAMGILTGEGEIDVERCRGFMAHIASVGMPPPEGVVFHRAFDFVNDQALALEQLIGLGFRRVMTSGGAATATQGAARIAELIRQSRGRIELLPAGGIRAQNVKDLIARTGCDQIHASVREPLVDRSAARHPQIVLGGPGNEHFRTSTPLLEALIRATRNGRDRGAIIYRPP